MAQQTLQAIKYQRGRLEVLDQLRLPHDFHYDEVSTAEEAFDCIKSMRVRGEPIYDLLYLSSQEDLPPAVTPS